MKILMTPGSLPVMGSLLLAFGLMVVRADEPVTNGLSIHWPASSPKPAIAVQANDEVVSIIELTPDLRSWSELLRGHGPIALVPDLSTPPDARRFYRAVFRRKTSLDDGKNVLRGQSDVFQSPEPPAGKHESRWVKFALLTNA